MEITSAMIKDLREKTGAGMMDCKRALEASQGDINAAIEYLRKKGAAAGAKRADRSAKEGAVLSVVADDARSGVLVEVNCETDFVGRSDDFGAFARAVAEAVALRRPASVEDLMRVSYQGKTIADLHNDLLARVGEKVEVRRFTVFQSNDGIVSGYTHLGNRIGVLVEIVGLGSDDVRSGLARDIAMQIAAMNPLVVSREQIDRSLVERELDIYRTQAVNEGKPAQIAERIAAGRLEKYYQEMVLLEQTFIKDAGKTIKDLLAEASKTAGRNVTVRRFQRYHLGEDTK